jgi:putative FmdB family regulatory protein
VPIYEYRCDACGHQEDHLQKISEPQLTVCPACGKPTYKKQLSAAGFQLKGSGWYATDFKTTGKKPADKKADSNSEAKTESKTESKPETKTDSKSDSKSDSKPESKPKAAATN